MRDSHAAADRRPRQPPHVLGPTLTLAHLPIPVFIAREVSGHHLRRAAALELEGQEPVVGADVQAALAANVRPRQPVDDRASKPQYRGARFAG